MGIFRKKPKQPAEKVSSASRNIAFFHRESGSAPLQYTIPDTLWKYYYYRPSAKKPTQFETEVDQYIKSGIDQYNDDFLNNRIQTLCDQALAELEDAHTKRQHTLGLLEVNKKALIYQLDLRIQALQKTVSDQEIKLSKEDLL